MTGLDPSLPALVPALKRDDAGAPYLTGARCTSCGHVYVGQRSNCANCLARDAMTPVRLADRGTLYSYTIIYRSFPGTEVPFIDAIVDLEDGGHLKGTLTGIAAEPEAIAFDMPVRVAFRAAEPASMPGHPHLTYHFVPA